MLKVWLPLDGDLRNLGASDVEVVNNGVTIDNAGKIGKCYYFNGTSSSYMTTSYSTAIGTNDFSIAMWVKIPTLTSGSYYALCTSKSASAASAGFGIYWNYSQKKFLWSTADGNGATEIWMVNTVDNIVYDKWIHLVMIRNNSDAKKGYFYINGNRYELTSVPAIRNITTDTKLNLGKCTNNYYPAKMYLNDFRIYNHALSAAEVKEIAMGLVLHYKLDKNKSQLVNVYNYPTFDTSNSNGGWSHWGQSGASGAYGQNTDKKYIWNKNNTYSHWVSNSSSATGHYLLYQSPTFDGGYRSTQCIVKEENGLPITTSIVYATWNAQSGGLTNNTFSSITHLGDGFYLCKAEGIKQDGSNDLVGFYVKPGYKVYFSEAYLENDKEICSDVFEQDNLTTVEDSSGYGHNGTINGTLTTSSDTTKYSSCVYMPKTTTITHPRPIYGGTDQEWTCCMWVKLDTTNQAGQQMNNFNSGNNIIHAANGAPLLYLNSGTNDYYNYGNLAVSAGVWTHIAFVFKNSNATKLIYINGVNHTNTTGPNKTSTPKGIPDIITVGTNLAGYISDYRIYCTPLLDTDIKLLYNVGMRVDNLGGVHTFEFDEYSNNKIASVQVVNSSATSFTFDKTTNTYTITSPVGTSSWGYGLRFADTPTNLIVPYGYSYRWSCDIFTSVATTFVSDYNNVPISGSAWSGNDNDLTSQRLPYSISIPANTWTTVILGSSNTHASNTSHISIRDYSSIGMITNGMSEPLVWKIRNLKWYLVEKEPVNSVNKKGQVISNFYNEDLVKKIASISNKSKSFSATEFIEI